MSEPAARACRVERLRLYRFRNYLDETVELGPGLTVVTGSNAQGKTTLLEAIATLALTRSPRAGSAAELIRWGEPACQVQARIRRPDGPVALDMRVERGDGDRAVRTTHVDGKARPARALLGVCPVVLFWPEDLMLVKGGPEGRRRLLDVVLSQLDARVAAELVRYRRVLEQRNALLRQARLGTGSLAALPAFTQELARAGGFIQVARARLCAALAALAEPALAELSGGGEELGLRYLAEGVDGGDPGLDATAAAAALSAALGARAAEEAARGVTVVGPHRDDVEVVLGGRPARTTASQGQQRSIVLALKLAEVRHVGAVAGMAPVLLLDDVLSELDGRRRERLLAGLGATSAAAQALLTTAEDSALDLAGLGAARRLVVEGGRVRDEAVAGGDAVA